MNQIKISELFYSIQGEGRYMGVPSVFLRTFGCNFKCGGFGMPKGELSNEIEPIAAEVDRYKTVEELPLVETGCDSYASWHPAFKHLSPTYDNAEVVEKLLALAPGGHWRHPSGNDTHLVITGGEPLLGWQREYADLLDRNGMQDLQNLTFETNGTQHLHDDFRKYLTEWTRLRGKNCLTFSVSPKLSCSGESYEDAIRPEVVAEYDCLGFTYLKFVVEKVEDFTEVEFAINAYRSQGFTGVVYVMPVGGVVSVYNGNRINVAEEALRRGYRYSPRLHVDIWGNAWSK